MTAAKSTKSSRPARAVRAADLKQPTLYSTRLSRAGALLPDTKLMLASWDLAASVEDNVRRMREENVFAKAARKRVTELLTIFRTRYLYDPQVLAALVTLVQVGVPDAVLHPILYYFTARDEPLLRDAVRDLLAPLRARGQFTITTPNVIRWLREQEAAGRTERAWGDAAASRLAQALLSTLRDFGILEGKASKRIAPAYLPVPAFAFIAFVLHRGVRSGEKLLRDPAWELFFLSPHDVEHYFVEAQQERLLTYEAAGRVIRVTFPTESLEEYAHALAGRSL